MTPPNDEEVLTSASDANGSTPPKVADAALDEGKIKAEVAKLAALPTIVYETKRKAAAQQLGMRGAVLDQMVKKHQARHKKKEDGLPHWHVEPSSEPVECAPLLDAIKEVVRRYIVLPAGADDAVALWVLHAWTFDAAIVSPFLALVSPTKRCGKTNTLILLLHLTPRSVLASNISPSAVFRYIDGSHPTLLVDEGDALFNGGNEELRGILNSGHTKTAAYVIRNVEVDGEHQPRRFSTWAPKAIAIIGSLPDTLEDRSIVVPLQRKPKGTPVERLRQRDCPEFAELRGMACRWAQDSFDKLVDADPSVPDALNDRAADNWRPLFAIADLASGNWPVRAREAACLLSGEGHDNAVNVRLLADIREVCPDEDVIRSDDLIEKLTADPEKPYKEWKQGRPLTQRQLAGLLKPFGIVSDTVHVAGRKAGKGYKRASFQEAWERYLPGQNSVSPSATALYPDKRTSADEAGTSRIFSSGQEPLSSGSKNEELSYNHAGLSACPDRNGKNGPAHDFDKEKTRVGGLGARTVNTRVNALGGDSWADLDIPPCLDRRPKLNGDDRQ